MPDPASPPSRSYAIPCTAAFRDRVTALAAARGASVADLARAILLTVPARRIDAFPDPGEPAPDEREPVRLKSGPMQDRVVRRKPRLQARLAPGLQPDHLRRALAMALALADGELSLALETEGDRRTRDQALTAERAARGGAEQRAVAAEEEVERLRLLIAAVSFEPLPGGVSNRRDALYVLGFAPHARPDDRTIRAKFRLLATVYHPDSRYGDTERMSQLNEAARILRET